MKTTQQLDSEIRNSYAFAIANCAGDWNDFSFRPITCTFFNLLKLTVFFDDEQFTGLCAKLEGLGGSACVTATSGDWEPVITDNFWILGMDGIMEELQELLTTDIKRNALREALDPIREALAPIRET